MKARVSDIAKRANVSSTTVSRVIHGYHNVNAETRQRVQKVIQELQYKPKTIIVEQPSKNIGLVVGDIRNPFFGDMVYRIQECFLQYGYVTIPLSNEFDPEKEKSLLKIVEKSDFAALILVSSMDSNVLKRALEGIECPVTLTDRVIDGFVGNVVIQDNFQAGYLATKHLIDLGYHKIAFLAGNTSSASSKRRVDGYREALANAFLPIDETLIMPGQMSFARGYHDGLAYIDQLKNMPRAILAANDMTAIGFLEACKKRGVRVPEDISVVGFDGIELSSLESFDLTTVCQPVQEMAKRICELTIEAIRHPNKKCNHRVILEPTLIIRGTTCENMHEI